MDVRVGLYRKLSAEELMRLFFFHICIKGFFLNLILFFNFTILFWFCHISKWIRHRYTCVPHPEPSTFLPPHTIPLGRPSAPAPSIWVLEKILESPLDCKEIQPVNPKGHQSWTFTGRTDAEAETPILWPPDVKNLMWRTESLEKPWCWERLKAGREGDDRGWDGWMASSEQWTWVWASSGR